MARARNIKPGFFQNDELGDLDPIARLLFIGLWTIADFKGCIEFRPKRIKAQILPYDKCDIEELSINLDKSGFISIYSVLGQRYIKVVNFDRHQNPHKNERDSGSDLPDISEKDIEINELSQDGNTPDKNGTNPADSLFLIPSSLIPSSLIPDTVKKPRALAPPSGVSESLWDDFRKLRVTKKAPITQTAIDGINSEAGKAGISLSEALGMCCSRGWTGFKADWVADKLNTAKNTGKHSGFENKNYREGVNEDGTFN